MKRKIIGAVLAAFVTVGATFVVNEKKDEQLEEKPKVEENVIKDDKDKDKDTSPKKDKEEKEENKEKDENKTKEENITKLNGAEYKNKLDKIHSGLKDLDYLYSTGDITKMNSAAGDELKRWDDALNEIYKVLEKNLSKDIVNKLKKEQEEWIKGRDAKAKRESLEMEGTPSEALLYTQSLSQSTKLRCYELIEKYM